MIGKPLLIIAWGNRSRGDDAVGPLLLDLLRKALDDDQTPLVDLLEEHQLQPELALDLVGRDRVLLIDADVTVTPPFAVEPVEPGRDASLASHTLSPRAARPPAAADHAAAAARPALRTRPPAQPGGDRGPAVSAAVGAGLGGRQRQRVMESEVSVLSVAL